MTSPPLHNYNANKRLKPTEDYKHAICEACEVTEEKHLQLDFESGPICGYYTQSPFLGRHLTV
jgi:hypothetical protein